MRRALEFWRNIMPGRSVRIGGWFLVGLLAQALRYLRTTLGAPFQPVDVRVLDAQSLDQIEHQQRIDLLRSVLLLLTGGTSILFFVSLGYPKVDFFARMGNLFFVLFSFTILLMSYTRSAPVAPYLLLGGAFFRIIFFAAIDPTGLSIRSTLLLSAMAILILAAGLFLPESQAKWVVILAGSVAWLEALILPIKGSFPASILNPHALVLVYLLILYVLTGVLSWMQGRTKSQALATFAAAYHRELLLEQQKEDFIHIASHELRAPLTPLLLASRMLERKLQQPALDPTDLQTKARDISRQVKRLNGMIDLLLDTHSVDYHRLALTIELCDLAEILRDVIQMQALGSHRTIHTQGTDGPCLLDGDPRRLWQVFMNLIGNAIKYTDDDTSIDVSVQAGQPDDASRASLQVSIRDAGRGIPATDLPYIFDRYYRVTDRPNARIEGWGIGLYLCRAITLAHQGTIEVQSTLDQGTVFTVTLPIHRSDAAPDPAIAPDD